MTLSVIVKFQSSIYYMVSIVPSAARMPSTLLLYWEIYGA